MAIRWKFWESPTKQAIKDVGKISPTSTQSPKTIQQTGLTSATKSTGQTGMSISVKSSSRSSGSGGSSGGGSSSGGVSVTPSSFEQTITQQKSQTETLFKATPSTAQPKQVSLPSTGDRGFVTIGFPTALKQTGINVLSRFGSPTSRQSDDILSPFDYTVKPKYAQEVYVGEGGELTSAERFTGLQKSAAEKFGFEITTFGEVQREREIKRGELISDVRTKEEKRITGEFDILQGGVSSGILPLGVAQERYGEIVAGANVRYTKEQQKIFKDVPDVKGIGERRSPVRDVVDIAALSNPLTSFTMAAVSSQKDPMKIDVGQIGGGVSIAGASTQRPSLRTGIFLGGGLIGAGSEFAQAGRGATQVRIESGFENLKLQVGVQKPLASGLIKEELVSASKVEGAIGFGRTTSVSRQIGDKGFKTAGLQESTVVAKEFFSDKPLLISETRAFTGKGTTLPRTQEGLMVSNVELASGIQGQTFARQTTKGMDAEFRRFFKPQDIRKEFFTGVSKKQGDLITGVSGKSRLGLEAVKGEGFTFVKPPTIKFNVETKSLVRQVGKPSQEIDIFAGGGGAGRSLGLKQTPLSKTFALPSQKIVSPKPQRMKTLPRASLGTGFEQEQVVSGKQFKMGEFQTPSLISLTETKPRMGIMPRTKSISLLGTGLRTPTKQKSLLGQQIVSIQSVLPAEAMKSMQLQQTGLKQLQIQELAKPMFTPPTFRGRGTGGGGFGGGFFGFPAIKLPTMGEKPKGKRPKSKRKLFRIPSFAAVELGFTSPKPLKGETTGLIERPLITKKKRKKK